MGRASKASNVLAIAVCLQVFGLGWFPVAANEPNVVAVEATIAPWLERDDYVGTFVSPQSASLSPQVAGLIDRVHFDVGQAVAQDAVVMELNTDLATLEVTRAQAMVAEREIVLDEATRLLQEVDRPPVRELLPETERLARGAAEQGATAALRIAQAELNIAERRLQQHLIRAPFAGTVVTRPTEIGEWVTPGTGVLRLVRGDGLWLDVRLPQRRSASVERVVRFEVTIDALPGQTFDARLLARVPASREDTRTFLMRLLVDDLPSVVLPGMSAKVVVTFGADMQALVVPRDALIRRADDAVTVWTLAKEDAAWFARERKVVLGQSGRDEVTIIDGLQEGELVVIRGNETLREGQLVNPTFD